MTKKIIFLLLCFTFLQSASSTTSHSKGGGPIAIKPDCIYSNIYLNKNYKVVSEKKGLLIFSYQEFLINVEYAENNLVVKSTINKQSDTLAETVDSIWRKLANTCQKETAYPVTYQ